MLHAGERNAGKVYANDLMEFACVTRVVRGPCSTMIRVGRLRGGGLGRCLDAPLWAGRLETYE
jgi:hypothetical protein